MCDVTQPTIERWLERNKVRPYRDEEWLRSQIEQYVSERAIAEWCGVTEETVKRWMRKFDIDHPGLAPASVMESFLEERFEDLDEVPKKTQISFLWQRHQVRVQYSEIARAVGTTPSYVRQTVGASSGGLIEDVIDSMGFLGSESIPDDLADDVRKRDDGSCVRCGSSSETEIHHIIPGKSTKSNLATLCRECHREAHEGDYYSSGLAYDSREGFWDSWIQE